YIIPTSTDTCTQILLTYDIVPAAICSPGIVPPQCCCVPRAALPGCRQWGGKPALQRRRSINVDLRRSESRRGCCRCWPGPCRECRPCSACNTGLCTGTSRPFELASARLVRLGQRMTPALADCAPPVPAQPARRNSQAGTSR